MKWHNAFLIAFIALAPQYAMAADQPTGKIVWSVTTEKDNHVSEGATFFFRQTDGNAHDYASYRHDQGFLFKDKTDFTDEDRKGGVVILTVPAGSWKFSSYSVMTMAGVMYPNLSVTFFPSQPFDIPFKVEPGKTTYIGSFRSRYTRGNNVFGVEIYTGAYFTVADEHERDLKIAKAKDPSIGDTTVAIPDITALNLPNFRSETISSPAPTPVAPPQ